MSLGGKRSKLERQQIGRSEFCVSYSIRLARTVIIIINQIFQTEALIFYKNISFSSNHSPQLFFINQIILSSILNIQFKKKQHWLLNRTAQYSYFKYVIATLNKSVRLAINCKIIKSQFILGESTINNKINISAMSNQNNSLLTFLKKQSLFGNSPNKNMNRKMSSRSRQKKSELGRQNNNFNTQPSVSPARKLNFGDDTNMQPSPRDNNRVSYQNSFQNKNTTQNNYATYDGANNINGNVTDYNVVNYSSSINQVTRGNPEERHERDSKNSTNTAQQHYSSSYEFARSQTALRLEELGSKIRTEINALNIKIDMFGQQMSQYVSAQSTHVKERIYRIVQDALKDSEQYIYQYIRKQQAKFTEELLRCRAILVKQIENIESMRQDINKPYWKNSAGVFITSQFEGRVQAAIVQCETIRYKTLDQSIVGYQLNDLEKYLFDIVRDRIHVQREKIYGV